MVRHRVPLTYMFEDDGIVPNHPRWPLIIYRKAVSFAGDIDPATAARRGIPGQGGRRNKIAPLNLVLEVTTIVDVEQRVSRAFVRESSEIELLPDREVSTHSNDVTAKGLAQIESALQSAQQTLRAARKSGDGAAISQAARDLRYWMSRRSSAKVAPAPSGNVVVRFGHTVKIAREDGREQTFRIVGEDEADPARGTISHVSPLARALFGRGPGELARVGDKEVEILKIT